LSHINTLLFSAIKRTSLEQSVFAQVGSFGDEIFAFPRTRRPNPRREVIGAPSPAASGAARSCNTGIAASILAIEAIRRAGVKLVGQAERSARFENERPEGA